MTDLLTRHDKAIALLKSIAAECESLSKRSERGGADHSWRKCRHCLAIAEADEPETRAMLRRFLDDLAGVDGAGVSRPSVHDAERLSMPVEVDDPLVDFHDYLLRFHGTPETNALFQRVYNALQRQPHAAVSQ